MVVVAQNPKLREFEHILQKGVVAETYVDMHFPRKAGNCIRHKADGLENAHLHFASDLPLLGIEISIPCLKAESRTALQ